MAVKFPARWQRLQLPGVASQVDLSNDGALLAVSMAGTDGACIEVYRTADGTRVAAYGEGAHAGRGVAFTGDDLHFAVEHADTHKVELMRVPVAGGTPARVAEYGLDEAVMSLVRSRGAEFVAVLGGVAEVWELDRGEVVRSKEAAQPGKPIQACFSPDAARLYLYGTEAGQIVVLDVADDTEVARFDAPQPFGAGLSVSPSGTYLYAVGEFYQGAALYRLPGGEKLLPELYTASSRVGVGAFSRGGATLFHATEAVSLPAGEREPLAVGGPGQPVAMAGAWEAPVVAYSNFNADLFWAVYEGE